MNREDCDQAEGRATHELFIPVAPAQYQVMGGRKGAIEVEAALVAQIPRAEIAGPPIRRPSIDTAGIGDHGREQTRIVHSAPPERLGQAVVPANFSGQRAQIRHLYAKGVRRIDTVARHVRQRFGSPKHPQAGQHFL